MMENNNDSGKKIFAVIFLILLLSLSLVNLAQNAGEIWGSVLEQDWSWSQAQASIKNVETAMGEELVLRLPAVDLYGGLQRLMGKHEQDNMETLIDKKGFLYGGNFWIRFGDDTKDMALRIKALQQQMEEKGTPFGVILYPMNIPQEENMYYGLPYQDQSIQMENFASWIRYYGIPYLDLRDNWKEVGLTQEEAFFKTDHHWTPLASFYGYTEILDWFETQYGMEIPNKEALCDLNQYHIERYENVMFGSKGREAGLLFSQGQEDYTVIYPKEEGDYYLKVGDLDDYNVYKGSFYEALIDTDYGDGDYEDIYKVRGELTYLHSGTTGYVSLENKDAPVDKRILLLRDSYSTNVAAFLSQTFSRIDMLWTVEYDKESMARYLEENEYDYVFFGLYTENITSSFFPFGE